jgi:hypothetical protein
MRNLIRRPKARYDAGPVLPCPSVRLPVANPVDSLRSFGIQRKLLQDIEYCSSLMLLAPMHKTNVS